MAYNFISGDSVGEHGITFIKEVDRTNPSRKRSMFKCSCGVHFECNNESITSKACPTKSCGCLHRKISSEVNTKHGHSRRNGKTKLYNKWNAMKARCYDQNNPRYIDWGGRGISVCDEWLGSFSVFEAWASSHGFKDCLELDRIDNDGNYEPSNCRFVTREVNTRNRRVKVGNKTGISGVAMNKKAGKYRVTIGSGGGKSKHIGFYSDFFEACCARKSAENRYWND